MEKRKPPQGILCQDFKPVAATQFNERRFSMKQL